MGLIYLIHRGVKKSADGLLKPDRGLTFRRTEEHAKEVAQLLNETLIRMLMLQHFATHFNNLGTGGGAKQLTDALISKAALDGFLEVCRETPQPYEPYGVTAVALSDEEERELAAAASEAATSPD